MVTVVECWTKMKEGERRAAGILRGSLYVLYLTPVGTCTLNRNRVMNYVAGTHCKETNSLYYMAECAFYVLDGLAFFIKLYRHYPYV